MTSIQVCVWAGNAGVGVSQWAAETMGICQEKGDWTTQWKDNKVRQCIWEIAQSMSISNTQGVGLKHWDLLINCCATWISHLAAERPHWKRYMADKTMLRGEKLKAAQDELRRLAITKERIGSMKPQLRRENGCTLVSISSPWCFLCHQSWWVDTEDNEQETSGDRYSLIMVCHDALTAFDFEPFHFTSACVDPNVAVKRVGENNTQLCSLHWRPDNESILSIVPWFCNMTFMLIVNAAIAGLPDPCWKIRELSGW